MTRIPPNSDAAGFAHRERSIDPGFSFPPGVDPLEHQRRQRAERYHLIRYAMQYTPTGARWERDRHFDGVAGTHLFIDEIQSPWPLAVRLGGSRSDNPFITVLEGDTIERPYFTGLSVRHLGPSTDSSSQTNPSIGAFMRAYVSTGPLIHRPRDLETGLRRGFRSALKTATTTAVYLFADMNPLMAGVIRPGFLKRGGSFSIRNQGPADLHLQWGQNPGVIIDAESWPILPGEIQTFRAAELLEERQMVTGGGGAIVVGTLAGTADYRVLVNSAPWDSSEPQSRSYTFGDAELLP